MSDFEPVQDFPTRRQLVAALASESYPELEEILEERPPLEASIPTNVGLTMHASKQAQWTDVQQKAHDIFKIDGVRIIASDKDHVAAHVLGDHGTYESEIQYVPGTKAPAMWNCSCPWAAYSWGRSGRWKKYEGRVCSHVLALMYEAQHDNSPVPKADWDTDPITHYEAPPPKEWRAAQLHEELAFEEGGFHVHAGRADGFDDQAELSGAEQATLAHLDAGVPAEELAFEVTAATPPDVREAVHLWSSIKVNNQLALPNPKNDGFRYAFHDIMGDAQLYRNDLGDPEFLKGEQLAITFLRTFIANARPTAHVLYRAIGLDDAKYNAMIIEATTKLNLDLPPASWSAQKMQTEQFGTTYAHDASAYPHRIVFVTRPGTYAWALGRTSMTGYEKERVVGGRFSVTGVDFPTDGGNLTTIHLQQVDPWPEDIHISGDILDHIVFDAGADITKAAGAENQPRDADGKWRAGNNVISHTEARGDSRAVTHEDFKKLEEAGKVGYDRLVSKPRPARAFNGSQWSDVKAAAHEAVQEEWGGQTIDPETGKPVHPEKGYAMAIRKPGEEQLSVPIGASADELAKVMDEAKKVYSDRLGSHGVYLGVFRDDDEGRIDVDPTAILDTEHEVDSIGAYCHSIGGAYNFATETDRKPGTGIGHFPPHVRSSKTGALQTKDYEGEVGNYDHITRVQTGTIPLKAIQDMEGGAGEFPGEHRNKTGQEWADFKADIKANGIRNPIFIVVDPRFSGPKIYEGNHRRDAALEVGMTEVPVEIRYFGHAERTQKVAVTGTPVIPYFPGTFFHPVKMLADAKQGYKDLHPDLDMPGQFHIDYFQVSADPVTGKEIADLYYDAPLYDPDAQPAYDQLIKETAMQYEYLTQVLGIRVEVSSTDPYKNVEQLIHDITVNHHQFTLSTATTGHKLILPTGRPIMTDEENDRFRAVHDAFGHAASGRAFDRNGEAAAWVAHMQMFSPLAGRAVTTETHARNSVLIYGTPEQKTGPAFAAQKVFLLPEKYSDTSIVINPFRKHSATQSFSYSEQYLKTGHPTPDDFYSMVEAYIEMHGKFPHAQYDKLRAKVRPPMAPLVESKMLAKLSGLPVAESAAPRPMDVDSYAVGDRVEIPISGATGEVVKVLTRDNGYRVRLDDEWLEGKPAFYEKEVRVSPLNLKHARYLTVDEARQMARQAAPGFSPLVGQVQSALSDDLRKKHYQGNTNQLAGHCYVASEALYHMMGGKDAGLKPMFIQHEGEPHWFLKDASGNIIDATASQFKTPVPYDQATGKGFLTREPSHRARIVMDRVQGTMTAALFPSMSDDTPPGEVSENEEQKPIPESQQKAKVAAPLSDVAFDRELGFNMGSVCQICGDPIVKHHRGWVHYDGHTADPVHHDHEAVPRKLASKQGVEIHSETEYDPFAPKPGSGICPECYGDGAFSTLLPDGSWSPEETCPACGGSGVEKTTATLHEEPEPALPTTDGATEEELDYGNGVGNFSGAVRQDPYTPQPWAVDESDQQRSEIYGDDIEKAQGIGEMSSAAGLADEGDDEDQKNGDEIFGDNIADASGMGGGTAYQGQLTGPAWLNPANGGGGDSPVGDSDIADAARQYLAHKNFNRAEQEALINEGEDRHAANLGSLDLEGTHYQQLEEALAMADDTGESVLWW